MLLKERSESEGLMAMRYLNTRIELTKKERFHYLNLEKGYEGELKFDLLAKNLQEERFIINDLLLELNNSHFQIDSLIISQGVIHLLDIKNFEGDCYLESDKLFSVTTGREYKNPVNQLKRCATLFRQLLQNLQQNYPVEASVIFINPEFTLYQAPMDQPIFLPTQVNRFFRDINNTPSTLNEAHQKLAQKLISLHQTKNRFTLLPEYSYDQLKKGVYCKNCRSFQVTIKNSDFVCHNCGEQERIEQAILRNVKEFKQLFPDRNITTQSIYEWCKVDLCKKTIRRILKKNYAVFGKTRGTYYK
jgi:RNase P subunit RPR2